MLLRLTSPSRAKVGGAKENEGSRGNRPVSIHFQSLEIASVNKTKRNKLFIDGRLPATRHARRLEAPPPSIHVRSPLRSSPAPVYRIRAAVVRGRFKEDGVNSVEMGMFMQRSQQRAGVKVLTPAQTGGFFPFVCFWGRKEEGDLSGVRMIYFYGMSVA